MPSDGDPPVDDVGMDCAGADSDATLSAGPPPARGGRPARARVPVYGASLKEPTESDDERDFADSSDDDDNGNPAPAPRARRPPARRAPRRTDPSSSDDDDGGASSSDNDDLLTSDDEAGAAAPRAATPEERPDAPVPLPTSTLAAAAAAERVLAVNPAADAFHVKLRWTSHRATVWVPGADLRAARPALARAALARAPSLSTAASGGAGSADGGAADDDGAFDDDGWAAELKDGVHPDWLEIDRVIAETSADGRPACLVKWEGLGYADATWEWEADLTRDGDADAVAAFRAREKPAAAPARPTAPASLDAVPPFLNGRTLRDYQVASLRWMVAARADGRNVILGDEMGLGKTAQSAAALWWQRHYGRGGPFLVVAPLTTLGHWARELRTWTPMNVVVYAGSAADRAACRAHEWWRAGECPWRDDGAPAPRSARPPVPKFDVLLTSYETLRTDAAWLGDKALTWQSVVVDEAHRLKTAASATRAALTAMDAARRVKWMLLLTGTPVQNNMRELCGLLNVLNPAHPRWRDEASFFEAYGGAPSGPPPTPAQIKALQADLAPVLLRRMKEDVEKGLPAKEEVVVRVELTREQRAYYRAIYERRVDALLAGGAKANLPNLRNLAMELRKVCCHPWLCAGLEDDYRARAAAAGRPADGVDALVAASGKMVLLSKLLPKLRAEGRKVLIFSQFKMMLDVLEDACRGWRYPVERIDGGVPARARQAAIDRFSKPGSDGFVFLLSTRAGGQGITLTAADTCVIYDSDFNPQNDLQAMARCHRIGQSKDVTVYRLVCNDTYEQTVFEAASKKYGLDEAILGAAPPGAADDPEASAGRIADLLKHGAVRLDGGGGEEAAAAAGDAFEGEGIDAILSGRTEKRQLGSRAGNSFSVASFAADAGASPPVAGGKKKRRGAADADDDRAFWAALLPDAVAARDAALLAGAAALGPRRRGAGTKKTYNEAALTRAAERGGVDDETGENGEKRWYKYELEALWPALLAFGEGRAADVARAAGLADRPADQVDAVCAAIAATIRRAAAEAAVTAARGRGEVGGRVPAAPAVPAWLKRAFKDFDVSGRAAKDAARNAERSADHRARVASNGKPLVPSLVDRLETRAVLARTMAAAGQGDQAALRALAAASAAVAHRTTAPSWWEPRHDRALLAAVAARGHNPAPKAAADECVAILRDASLTPMPLTPEAAAWVADALVTARRRHADAVDRAAAAAAARSPPTAEGENAPPPPPPAAAPAPFDEAAEERRAWDALGGAIAKRLGRLLEALLRPPPPKPAAAAAPLHRPAAEQATVPSMFRPRDDGGGAAAPDSGPRLPPRPALPKGKAGKPVPAAVAAALAAGAGAAPLAPRTAASPSAPRQPAAAPPRANGGGGQEERDPNRPPSAAAKARAASAGAKRPPSAGGGAAARPMKQTRLDFGQKAKAAK